MITAFHGIGAYRGQKNPLSLRRMLDTAMGGVELCAADRPIGAFGAVFLGNCRMAFDRDVWSEVDETGKRTENCWWGTDQISDPSQCEFEAFAKNALNAREDHPRSYCEAWLEPNALRALWVKDWASASTQRTARVLAKNRKVPLITVSGTVRIWDLLDHTKLPVIPAIYARV